MGIFNFQFQRFIIPKYKTDIKGIVIYRKNGQQAKPAWQLSQCKLRHCLNICYTIVTVR